MNEKERMRLVKELKNTMTFPLYDAGMIADLIIKDREIILAPLLIAMNESFNTTDKIRVFRLMNSAINETLKRAGLMEERK